MMVPRCGRRPRQEEEAPPPTTSRWYHLLQADGKTASDFKYKVVNDSLCIENQLTNKGVYIKIGTKDKEI
jgi:hypothetical protein